MARRIASLVLLFAFSLVATGCGDSSKPNKPADSPPPKGGPLGNKGPVAPPPPPPPS